MQQTETGGVLTQGDRIVHRKFGSGTVEVPRTDTAIVRFEHGLEECEVADLEQQLGLYQAIDQAEWHDVSSVITKCQALAIESVNDSWGVFSRSRIALLPHQLWVCHRTASHWPIRYLIADDVGLGKTIEAGLILWPLISKSVVKRFLILCPASLVEQWQTRLREMFDIRVSRYVAEADTDKSYFWDSHNQVVASLSTLRDDRNGRHQRMLDADSWDLVIVDEAHHLYADKSKGSTLGYRFVEKLLEHDKVESCVFFTGTPHRGKPYGFWSLMSLLRPDLFDPNKSYQKQIPSLREAFIRNNKTLVTDMHGKKLFKPLNVSAATYSYSEEEEQFYQLLTEFIADGKAYATSLSSKEKSQVVLVLIAMQKLASSSVAAIRQALQRRLARLHAAQKELRSQIEIISNEADALIERCNNEDLDFDETSIIDVKLAESNCVLMEQEIPHLEELLEAACAVCVETKITKILELLDTTFKERQVLFFTEYKATQSMLISALMEAYGKDCVAFINGDEKLEAVQFPHGSTKAISYDRKSAAARFNTGEITFLVSTEAGGEGIDLQHRCHSLVHVDLPWNPMRLHQRVGRLYRYGQTQEVDVVTLRNPHTVEARIWDLLNEKLEDITSSLSGAMDDPEDMLQMVLGMASGSMISELFANADSVNPERLDEWFNEKSSTLGGESSIETVKSLVGNAARFDLSVLEDVPDIDLPDLRPFFTNMLTKRKRRVVQSDDAIDFKTPDEWRTDPGILRRYEGLIFRRNEVGTQEAEKIMGVGHKLFDKAIQEAKEYRVSLAHCSELTSHLLIVRIFDRLTGNSGNIRQSVVGLQQAESDKSWVVLRDWELLKILNGISGKQVDTCKLDNGSVDVDEALGALELKFPKLKLPFRHPVFEPLCLICADKER